VSRREFSKATKRLALKRSGFLCEAVGAMYNLPVGKRCNSPLGSGVEYDHIVLEANSHDNSLENCAAVCIKCHRWKSAKHDTPMAAKTVRMQDKFNGIERKKAPIHSAGFPQKPKAGKIPVPPPKSLFKPAEERT
jgi:5-methylcytosine-specific restriction endonuclease McrA